MNIITLISQHLLIFSFTLSLVIVASTWTASLLIRHLSKRYLDAVSRVFSRLGYVRVHLILGGALLLLLGHWFSEAAELAFESDATRSLDLEVANALHRGATGLTVALFGSITELGGLWAQVMTGLIVLFALLRMRERLLGAVWLFGLAGGSLLNSFLKSEYQRQRPSFADPFLVEKYYSFPSGHAMGSVVMYGLLTYLFFVLAPNRYRNFAVGLALLLGTLIGISRLVLGVHYFSDVLAGWIMGALWVILVTTASQLYRNWRVGSSVRVSSSSPQPTLTTTPIDYQGDS